MQPHSRWIHYVCVIMTPQKKTDGKTRIDAEKKMGREQEDDLASWRVAKSFVHESTFEKPLRADSVSAAVCSQQTDRWPADQLANTSRVFQRVKHNEMLWNKTSGAPDALIGISGLIRSGDLKTAMAQEMTSACQSIGVPASLTSTLLV
ncbi:unnamed protein product [Caenorhabditis auriculariae]|uniref:Uncharacterized protein n=1 Tax=Caenorhabditis auriculariae TaxID=2777116 RepID=A0A8S1HZY4_9PELO|nr:unnamed protein product [Caenorhabditis auriculariae]